MRHLEGQDTSTIFHLLQSQTHFFAYHTGKNWKCPDLGHLKVSPQFHFFADEEILSWYLKKFKLTLKFIRKIFVEFLMSLVFRMTMGTWWKEREKKNWIIVYIKNYWFISKGLLIAIIQPEKNHVNKIIDTVCEIFLRGHLNKMYLLEYFYFQ